MCMASVPTAPAPQQRPHLFVLGCLVWCVLISLGPSSCGLVPAPAAAGSTLATLIITLISIATWSQHNTMQHDAGETQRVASSRPVCCCQTGEGCQMCCGCVPAMRQLQCMRLVLHCPARQEVLPQISQESSAPLGPPNTAQHRTAWPQHSIRADTTQPPSPPPGAPSSLPVTATLEMPPALPRPACFFSCFLRALSRLGMKASTRQRSSLDHVTSASCGCANRMTITHASEEFAAASFGGRGQRTGRSCATFSCVHSQRFSQP